MRIKILTTGGTIASKIDPVSGGAVPALSGDDLLSAIPGLDKWEEKIEVEDTVKLPSDYIDPDTWKAIATRVNEVLDEEDVLGTVITHGTDTLEETAYFLDLVVKSSKPVVLTGAQRNASEWDNDGPRNLLNALRIVRDKQAIGMGVMICLNGQICPARDGTKSHTFAVETFNSGIKGFIGEVVGERVKFHRKPLRRLGPFSPGQMVTDIDIIPMYAGADGKYLDLAIKSGVSGVIIQGLGLGNVNVSFYKSIKAAISKGIFVVISTRVPNGFVLPTYSFEGGGVTLKKLGVIFSGDLNPWKARILLMLALASIQNKDTLQELFDS